MITKILDSLKHFFTLKQLTILPLVFLTLVLFIFNKILHVEWYISMITAIVFAAIVPRFINPNWDSKLLKFNLFQKYLNFMLIFESFFLSSFMVRFTTGVYFFIIFEVMHQSTDFLVYFICFFLFFLFFLYFRLRSQIFSINELAYDVINEISPSHLKNHFFKMLGVQLNLNFQYNYCLMGFPKRTMFSMREIGTKFAQWAGRFGSGATVGAVTSYVAYHSDQEASQHNKLAHEQIRRLTEKHILLTEKYHQRFPKTTPESENIQKIMEESTYKLNRLNTFAKQQDRVGVRIFNDPLPTNPEYHSLQSDAMQSLVLLQSRIDPSSHIEIQKTAFSEILNLVSKSIFI